MNQFSSVFLSLFFLLSCQCNPNSLEKNKIESIQMDFTGIHTESYENGKPKITGNIVKGIRQGTWYSFYNNGRKWSEVEYLHGKKNGFYKIFHATGHIKIHGVYKNDQKFGIWRFYDENGKFAKEIDFDLKNKNDSI